MWPEAHQLRAPVHDWPPAWACSWGDDRYGVWAEFEVAGVVQRMRWIEPGSFMMGSPDAEPGRHSDEGPQHTVHINEGLWLADTPCTQALWQAVYGGGNPSRFKDGERWQDHPVEQVDAKTVNTFLGYLQSQMPAGCQPVLPTEAQWEYACRAGTHAAYCWGDKFDQARGNIGNQAEGTTPVKQFEANPWGLFDMHGNVWEWCADDMRDYSKEAQTDPVGDKDLMAHRVVRGGSWFNHAALARAAYRNTGHRGYRSGNLGFRLALRSTGPGGAGVGFGV
jgi:formylglycine-generating enzyme